MKIRPILAASTFALSASLLAQSPTNTWSGMFTASGNYAVNNQDSQSVLLIGKTHGTLVGGTLSLNALYSFSKQTASGGGAYTTTDNHASFFSQYDRTLSPKAYAYANLGFDHDAIAELDLRTLVGAGGGYYILPNQSDTNDSHWKVDAGVAYVAEKYEDGNNDHVGLQFGSDYKRNITKTVSFTHCAQYIPDVAGFGNYLFKSDAELCVTLSNSKSGKGWQATTGWIYNFTSQPTGGGQKMTANYVLGLSYKF